MGILETINSPADGTAINYTFDQNVNPESIIPFGFWEASLLGSLLLLSYFAIYKRDSVGVLQSLLPVPLYARNLYLKYREVFVDKHQGIDPAADPVETVGK